jgi:2,3,4,5-tetrahydropyridine-2-carboxylate N-succinyltransferase
MNSLQTIIEQAWKTELCYKKRQQQKPLEVIELLDAGKLRVAEPKGDAWQVNEWVKKSSCYVFSYPENGNMGAGFLNTTIKWN